MGTEKEKRDSEIEKAYQYLRQKDWERMNNQRDLMSSISVGLWMVGVIVLACIGTYAVLFGNL
tara:strand:+ start:1041 stop:1229 length:189 start_codon:yes stop_codon:yes gene_type:complete